MRLSLSGPVRRTAPVALLLAVLPLAVPAPAAARTRDAGSICSSDDHPRLASRLSDDIGSALAGRAGTVSVGLWDRDTGTWCGVGYTRHYDSASVVKAMVMAAVLRRAQEAGRHLTARENRLITAMITRSDNDATTVLWRGLGPDRVQRFLGLAGLSHTVLNDGGSWGLTRITAQDEMQVLALFDSDNEVLSPASRAYGMRQLASVVATQRWGTPAGAPSGVGVHVKNGWLPRSTHGWRVHSIGDFTRPDRPGYRLVVLSHDNRTMAYGVATIERVARVVHRDLDQPVEEPEEEPSDGPAYPPAEEPALEPEDLLFK
ncbi:serine hydrolase [Streptacidiphilus griseoplanus]|uniref:serine hydrolase n=1 Tax=Peterkaempfera griseoplana TaxID=66896 RepID=UPI0007C754FB|nr:serine hydrolase [Peterkaempfera griseoplana]